MKTTKKKNKIFGNDSSESGPLRKMLSLFRFFSLGEDEESIAFQTSLTQP